MKDLEDTLKKIEERAAKAPKQLPLWDEKFRGTPNEVIRSSLFTARIRGEREIFKDAVLFVLGDGEITYRGEELRTYDEDVWLQVMHIARNQQLGNRIEFTPYSMIKELGWAKGKNRPSQAHYERLRECLSRMQATTVTVSSKRLGHASTVSLIRKFEYRDMTGTENKWKVWVEPEMNALYGDVHYTQLEWERRVKLSPIAKRLHGWVASHRTPFPVTVTKLYQLCNIKSEQKSFKQALPKYLKELVDTGFLLDFEIKENLVRVSRANGKDVIPL